MLNTTTQSTKSGGPLAAAWAVVPRIGDDGYAKLARHARTATLGLVGAVDDIPALSLAAEPDSTLLAVTAGETCDVFTIADELLARGWYAQSQMSFGDLPATLHFSLSAATAASSVEIGADLAAATATAVQAGPIAPPEHLVAAASSIDPEHLDQETFASLLKVAGLSDGADGLELPQRMASVNALLDALPPDLREALLLGVIDRLARPAAAPASQQLAERTLQGRTGR
jgi:hypothetical protein